MEYKMSDGAPGIRRGPAARQRLAVLLLIASLALSACSGGGEAPPATPVVTSTAAATVASTPRVTPAERRTGIPELDAVIDAVISHDKEKVLQLVGYTPVPCEIEPQGLGAPPQCRADEPEGTAVDVFPVAQCEGYYVRPEDMEQVITSLLSGDFDLYAVYKVHTRSWLGGDYVAILSFNSPSLGLVGESLFIADGNLTGVAYSCTESPEQQAQGYQDDEVIIPPPDPAPTP